MAGSEYVLGEVTLDVVEQGSGPTLLFLHGADGLLYSSPLLDDLATSFHVVAPHHPAWGGSTRPRHVVDVRDVAQVYVELLEQLDEPPLVVGCSVGGWIAAELAVQARGLLAGLVLVAPLGVKLGDRETRDFTDLYMLNFDDARAAVYADLANAPDLRDRPDEDYQYLAVASEATTRYVWKPYMHNPKLRHWLRRIATPSLVISGDSDHLPLNPDYYAEYAALIGPSGAEVREIAGAGHRVEEEQPAELARIVRELAASSATDASPPLTATKGR